MIIACKYAIRIGIGMGISVSIGMGISIGIGMGISTGSPSVLYLVMEVP